MNVHKIIIDYVCILAMIIINVAIYYHGRRKGGARGALAPPNFTRGVLSTPILDLSLCHTNHVI